MRDELSRRVKIVVNPARGYCLRQALDDSKIILLGIPADKYIVHEEMDFGLLVPGRNKRKECFEVPLFYLL